MTLDDPSYLGDSIQWATNIENSFRVAWYAFADHHFGTTLGSDFINMLATASNNDRGVLGNNKTPHIDMCLGHRWRVRACVRSSITLGIFRRSGVAIDDTVRLSILLISTKL